jgi:NAD(P)-dependent dehydrogenase (short-subunit alcohol dehydrogenase family)
MLTILVTGATNGLGLESAKVLAGMGNQVLLHGRNPNKGRAALAAVEAVRAGSARFLQADFASLAQVRRLAAQVIDSVPRLDVLINNAGCANFTRSETEDGYETTFAVNHLAPFLLTNLLLDKIRQSAPARIVNVASAAHRYQHIDFDDLMSTRGYKVMRTYGRSKLANILFTRTLAKRLGDTGITANCLHPGVVHTGIGQNNAFARLVGQLLLSLRGIAVEEGARTIIYLASSPQVAAATGGYYSKCRLAPLLTSPEAVSEPVGAQLWRVSEQLVGLPCTSP